MLHNMKRLTPSPEEGDRDFVSPRKLAYLSDNSLAHDLIDELRWDTEPDCPRCASRFTKQVNTNVFRQLYRCIDCGYMFNSLAGTVFHGSKMPVTKYLQFFIMHNALQANLPLRDLGYALDVSHKTASLLMKRASSISYSIQFAKVDKKGSFLRSDQDDADGSTENAPFFSYCDIKSIAAADAPFRSFLRQLLREGVGSPTTWPQSPGAAPEA
jgi:transposase-like protein